MTEPAPAADEIPLAQQLGESYAALLGGEWELDNPEQLLQPTLAEEVDLPADPIPEALPLPTAEAVLDADVPPSPLQIIEAMLFLGGSPLSAETACQIIRGLTVPQFREWIDVLNRVYRMQNRPYLVTSNESGYTLTLRQRYRSVKERLYGGPREARLSQPALDVLALVAYRQPIPKGELDSIRGTESSSIVRQLVRLGLIAVVQRGEAKQPESAYGTTPRFLEVFNLRGLDDLPQLADPQQL